jgi:hypothetical protein
MLCKIGSVPLLNNPFWLHHKVARKGVSPGKKYATGERNQKVWQRGGGCVLFSTCLLNPAEYVCVPPVYLVVVDVLN